MQSISLKKRNKTKRFEYYLPEMKVIYKEPEELNKKKVLSVCSRRGARRTLSKKQIAAAASWMPR